MSYDVREATKENKDISTQSVNRALGALKTAGLRPGGIDYKKAVLWITPKIDAKVKTLIFTDTKDDVHTETFRYISQGKKDQALQGNAASFMRRKADLSQYQSERVAYDFFITVNSQTDKVYLVNPFKTWISNSTDVLPECLVDGSKEERLAYSGAYHQREGEGIFELTGEINESELISFIKDR